MKLSMRYGKVIVFMVGFVIVSVDVQAGPVISKLVDIEKVKDKFIDDYADEIIVVGMVITAMYLGQYVRENFDQENNRIDEMLVNAKANEALDNGNLSKLLECFEQKNSNQTDESDSDFDYEEEYDSKVEGYCMPAQTCDEAVMIVEYFEQKLRAEKKFLSDDDKKQIDKKQIRDGSKFLEGYGQFRNAEQELLELQYEEPMPKLEVIPGCEREDINLWVKYQIAENDRMRLIKDKNNKESRQLRPVRYSEEK